MLGELVYESAGKRTGRRVISTDGGFKVEVSFEGGGKMLGVDVQEIGTYTSQSRPDGTLFGEGQGVVIGADGSMATWKGMGVGKFTGAGSVAYRGAVYLYSDSPKFNKLNGSALVFEFESDAQGNTRAKDWEWK